MPKLIEKPIGMSREDAFRLPPLIQRKVWLSVTGIPNHAFRAMVDDGDINYLYVGKKKARRMFYRDEALRIAGYIRVEVKHVA
jgi:hypothetical protein